MESFANENSDDILGMFPERALDLAYEREQGEFAWTFTTPTGSDQLCLRLYAGVPGAAKGNGVIYRDVELLEWKYSAGELERLSPDERR